MFAYRHHRLILPLAPTLGVGLGLAVAALIAVMPAWRFESLVAASAVASVVAAARPPLGATARLLMLLTLGGGVALFAGLGLWLVFGKRTIALGAAPADPEVPQLRRADSHPDAPPRALVRAHRDLGAPLAAPAAGRPLPADLDRPLSAYDPDAIPDVPREPVPPVTPLVRFERPQLIDPGDRFETFDPAPAAAGVEPVATLNALLDRLERGIRHTRPSRSLDEALGELRRSAS
jgi:hypothetical protein